MNSYNKYPQEKQYIRAFNDPSNDSDSNYLNSSINNNNNNENGRKEEKLEELIFKEYEEKKEELSKLKISHFKSTNINLEKLNYCIQNVHWHEINKNREDLIRHYEMHQEGNRNNFELTAAEKEEKKNSLLTSKLTFFILSPNTI